MGSRKDGFTVCMCSLLNFKWWKWSVDQNFSKQWAFCDEQMIDLRKEEQEKGNAFFFIPYLLATLFSFFLVIVTYCYYLFFYTSFYFFFYIITDNTWWIFQTFAYCTNTFEFSKKFDTTWLPWLNLKDAANFTSYRSINHSHMLTTPIKSNFKISF